MLRTAIRRGHQLIKEPLTNEVDTFARKRRTQDHTLHEIYMYAGAAAVGGVLALYSVYSAHTTPLPTVTSKGKFKE